MSDNAAIVLIILVLAALITFLALIWLAKRFAVLNKAYQGGADHIKSLWDAYTLTRDRLDRPWAYLDKVMRPIGPEKRDVRVRGWDAWWLGLLGDQDQHPLSIPGVRDGLSGTPYGDTGYQANQRFTCGPIAPIAPPPPIEWSNPVAMARSLMEAFVAAGCTSAIDVTQAVIDGIRRVHPEIELTGVHEEVVACIERYRMRMDVLTRIDAGMSIEEEIVEGLREPDDEFGRHDWNDEGIEAEFNA